MAITKMTCLGVQHGSKYSENGTIITAPICGCQVQETCCHVLIELRTTCWDNDGVNRSRELLITNQCIRVETDEGGSQLLSPVSLLTLRSKHNAHTKMQT